jgi:hypothetical protein
MTSTVFSTVYTPVYSVSDFLCMYCRESQYFGTLVNWSLIPTLSFFCTNGDQFTKIVTVHIAEDTAEYDRAVLLTPTAQSNLAVLLASQNQNSVGLLTPLSQTNWDLRKAKWYS